MRKPIEVLTHARDSVKYMDLGAGETASRSSFGLSLAGDVGIRKPGVQKVGGCT